MRVTLDASIVMKWFFAEDLHGEARVLQATDIERHAPQLLLTECTNVLWKKARAGETADVEPLLGEILRLREAVDLHPDPWLLREAAITALRIGHPVYDCLYIACARLTDSILVTADRRLARVVSDQLPDLEILALHDRVAMERLGRMLQEQDA